MKIQGIPVGTPIKPKAVLVKCEDLTDREKALARENIGAASSDEVSKQIGDVSTSVEKLSETVDTNSRAIQDINSDIGDVETALDNIIAIQESIIGGDSA